jgi:hypothetical protein
MRKMKGQWGGGLALLLLTLLVVGPLVVADAPPPPQDYVGLWIPIVGTGAVERDPAGIEFLGAFWYAPGTDVALTPVAGDGFWFTGWSGDHIGTETPLIVTMDADKTITATFQRYWTLTVDVDPAVSGDVQVDGTVPGGYPATFDFLEGTDVALTALPNVEWDFVEWTGDLGGTNPVGAVLMDGDKDVTAHFVLHEYTLQVFINGCGEVTKTPDKTTYHYGDVVQLAADPCVGWHFADWAEDLAGSDNPEYLTIDGDKVVVASFARDEYVLDINIVGQGTVSKDPDQFTYHYGDVVELCETPDPCWLFVGWSGDASGTAACTTVNMDGHKTVTATFVQIEYTLATVVDPVGVGTVTGGGTYACGTYQQITATPTDACWYFVDWTGDGITDPDLATTTVHIDANKTVTANFAKYQYDLTVVSSPAEGGTVTGDGTYDCGTYQQITATPADACWYFVNWTGDGITDPNLATTTVHIDANKTVTANFAKIEYTLTTIADPAAGGTVTGGGLYDCGDTAVVEATPTLGWEFVEWQGDLAGISNPTTIDIDGDKTVTAVFEELFSTECTTLPADGWNMVSIPLSPAGGDCGTAPCWNEGSVEISLDGSGSDAVVFGVNPDAVDGIDFGFDVPNPPSPFPPYVDGYFVQGSDRFGTDIKAPIACEETKSWTLKIADDGSATQVTLSWDSPAISAGSECLSAVTLTDTVAGTEVDMQTTGTYTYTKAGDPETREFVITVVCHCSAGAVFGDYISPVILYQMDSCTGGYDPIEDGDVVPGQGYWLWVYEADTEVCVTGTPVTEDLSVALACEGWSQISSPWHYPKHAISFTDGVETKTWEEAVEAHWVEDALWQYDAETGQYVFMDGGSFLDPWYGYWMLTYEDGLTMILDYGSAVLSMGSMGASVSPKAGITSNRMPPPPPPAPSSAATAAGLVAYNEPNPIRDVHTTTFKVKGAVAIEAIRVEIFDLAGQLVFEDEQFGDELDWHTDNNYGEYLANGVYLYRVSAKVHGEWVVVQIRKLAIVR